MSTTEFFELTSHGVLRFAGDDARAFLHNQLSCDVAGLAPNRAVYGAYCTPKGRMLATFLLWRSEQGYFMQLPAALREPIQKQLTRFILRSKVKATDATPELRLIGVAGPGAASLVERVIGQRPGNAGDVAHKDGVTAIRLPGERCEIVAPLETAPGLIAALSAGASAGDPERWDWLDIRAGIATILPVTQETLVPQMANLDLIGGVSFEKGCYPGQEIVARMHYRGTLKQRLYLAHVAGDERPQPGDRLYSAAFGEQACGTVVNAARAPEGGCDLLASIQIAAAGHGSVHIGSPTGPALELLPLPYPVPAQE